ncbi:MAG: hypothetical protein KAT71_07520, partial [Gammaproteobacteria bacterium]|nr:hypothetical protein [Gammaproteobacteria bacterium]
MASGYIVRLSVQALAFVWLARLLGVSNFGVFATVVALVSFVAPVAGWGGYNLIMRNVVDGIRPGIALGVGLIVMLVFSCLTFGLLLLVRQLFFSHIALSLFFLIGLADLIGTQMQVFARAVFAAKESFTPVAILNVVSGLLKL